MAGRLWVCHQGHCHWGQTAPETQKRRHWYRHMCTHCATHSALQRCLYKLISALLPVLLPSTALLPEPSPHRSDCARDAEAAPIVSSYVYTLHRDYHNAALLRAQERLGQSVLLHPKERYDLFKPSAGPKLSVKARKTSEQNPTQHSNAL